MDPKRSINLRFVLTGAALPILIALLLIPTAAGWGFIAALTAPACGGSVDPASFGLAYDDVTFPAPSIGGSLSGYWIPAAGGADHAKGTVIGVPTGDAGRGDRLNELRFVQAAGYNILSYESRTCAAGRAASLGYLEVDQVGDALAYLQARPDVDSARIGIHGFSAGGATAIMAAARYPQIAAVVAQGGYADFWDEISSNTDSLWNGRIALLGGLFRLGVRAGYQSTVGISIDNLSPLQAIPNIAPRPVLLIYGSDEPSLAGARQMAAAGGDQVRLWEVPGAHHGDYVAVAGDQTYRDQVVAFWDAAFGGDVAR